MKDNFAAAIDLIRKVKYQSLTDKKAHRKSFNYFISRGYVEKAQWELVKQLTGYLFMRISSLQYRSI